MSDPIIEALREKVTSDRWGKRGDLRRWMRKRHAAIAKLRAEGMTFEALAEALTEHGATNDVGKPVNKKDAQRNWVAACKEVEAERAGRAEPQPRSDPLPAPVPVADAKPAPPARQEYREDEPEPPPSSGYRFGMGSPLARSGVKPKKED